MVLETMHLQTRIVTAGTDCNDNSILTSPLDADGDGFSGCDVLSDCNDNNPDIHPSTEDNPVSEICDGVDNDCDSLIDDADDNVDISTYRSFMLMMMEMVMEIQP